MNEQPGFSRSPASRLVYGALAYAHEARSDYHRAHLLESAEPGGELHARLQSATVDLAHELRPYRSVVPEMWEEAGIDHLIWLSRQRDKVGRYTTQGGVRRHVVESNPVQIEPDRLLAAISALDDMADELGFTVPIAQEKPDATWTLDDENE